MTDHKNMLDELDDPNSGELTPVLERLADWDAPAPTSEQTQRLVVSLQEHHAPSPKITQVLRHVFTNAWMILRGQMYVVQQEVLAASALVIALGTLLAWVVPVGDLPAPDGLALALAAPLISAVGMSFLYGTGMEPVVEMEMSTPMSPRKILLARMTLIFGFNLLLALAGSLVLAVGGVLGWTMPIDFFALVGIWLAPMAALSGLAFFLTVLSGDPLTGSALSLVIWGAQALRIFGQPAGFIIQIPDFFALEFRPVLWLFALVLGALGFWMAGREAQMLRDRQ